MPPYMAADASASIGIRGDEAMPRRYRHSTDPRIVEIRKLLAERAPGGIWYSGARPTRERVPAHAGPSEKSRLRLKRQRRDKLAADRDCHAAAARVG